MVQDLDYVRTKGDDFDFCYLLDNETLAFGHEDGNCAGGVTFAYDFYGDPREEYPDDHIPTKEYWDDVKGKMNWCKENNEDFYNKIIEMCKQHDIDIINIINEKTKEE